jgi:hypothetical protein
LVFFIVFSLVDYLLFGKTDILKTALSSVIFFAVLMFMLNLRQKNSNKKSGLP